VSIGIRQRMNENPGITAGVMTAMVVVAVCVVVYQVRAGRRMITSHLPDAFFTVDDGKTFFTAAGENVPPFDYNGQTAVHAYVFEFNGKRFVGYLERFTPEAHQQMIEGKATPATQMYGRELKRPGDKTWVKSGDLKAVGKVIDVQCPGGGSGTPEPVEP
jgi:hypothetical protein